MLTAQGQRWIVAAALIMLVALGTGVPSIAGTPTSSPYVLKGGSAAAAAERRKVLMTIESRMSDEKTLKKIREKIGGLDGKRLQIAAALCSRIERDEDSAGADIAFSLVTALIVLS